MKEKYQQYSPPMPKEVIDGSLDDEVATESPFVDLIATYFNNYPLWLKVAGEVIDQPEDVMQTAFWKAMRNIDQFNEGSMTSWFKVIVRNQAFNMRRQDGTEQKKYSGLYKSLSAAYDGNNPESEILAKERMEVLVVQ